MRKNHDHGPQENKKRTRKILREKRLNLTDSHCGLRVTAETLVENCYLSQSHAEKIISGSQKLKPAYEELLFYKLAGKTPFGPGYYMLPDGLQMPNGFVFSSDQLDQYSFLMQIHKSIDNDMKRLTDKVSELETANKQLQQRIDWINRKEEHEKQNNVYPIFIKSDR